MKYSWRVPLRKKTRNIITGHSENIVQFGYNVMKCRYKRMLFYPRRIRRNVMVNFEKLTGTTEHLTL
jgi:hypothetical protein